MKGIRARGRGRRKAEGFTLIEVIIALLILAIVMAALAPAYYGLLKATASSNQRSVANGLAVSATEQLRTYPYDEIGYYATAIPAGCPTTTTNPSANPVILSSTINEPIETLATSKTIGNVTYSIRRCVNWVNSTLAGDSLAYKQSVVTVSWPSAGSTLSVSQTSALYPGGEGAYSGPEDDYVPGGTTTTVPANPPSPPNNLSASDDQSAPTNTIDVSWTAPTTSPTPSYYIVLYTTTNPAGASIASLGAGAYAASSNVSGLSTKITVGAGTTYYFQVESVTSGVASTGISNTATATSASATTTASTTTTTTAAGSTTTAAGGTTTTSTTSTTVATCSINSLVVTPSKGGSGSGNSGVALTSNGQLASETSFGLAVNASSGCSNVTVGYAPSTCAPGSSGCATTYASMTGTGGTLFGTAGTASTVWTVGTQIFTVFVGVAPAQYSPLTQQQVIVCSEHGNSGNC